MIKNAGNLVALISSDIQTVSEPRGSAICNGSFGEVLQGLLQNNQMFLVNLKIKNYSRVTVYMYRTRYWGFNRDRYWKSYKLVANLLARLGQNYEFFIEINSNIPVGKGLSSSTADMVACARALERALSAAFEDETLSKEITAIEPNDGLHYAGTSLYGYTDGRCVDNFSFIPKFKIIGVDFGGEVDTLAFNRESPATVYDENDRRLFSQLLEELVESYRTQDADRIAHIATESVFLSQKRLYKPYLDDFYKLSQKYSALGVINTHSGTYLGMIFDREIEDYPEMQRCIRRQFGNVKIDLFETVTF